MTFDKNKILKQALKIIDKDDDVLTFEGIIDKLDCYWEDDLPLSHNRKSWFWEIADEYKS